MIISYSHKFIFFHIAKVAGLSIREVLSPYIQEPEKFKIRRPLKIINGKQNPMYDVWESFLLHLKARDAKKELSDEVYNSFFKFAFVRNPWDWHVSMYHFLLSMDNYKIKFAKGFDNYIEWVINEKHPYPRGASKFQSDMITDLKGNLIVDFIGKYENLEKDFGYICQVLNINDSLPHINRTEHRDYRCYYNEKTKKMVEYHFNDDIMRFGYTF